MSSFERLFVFYLIKKFESCDMTKYFIGLCMGRLPKILQIPTEIQTMHLPSA